MSVSFIQSIGYNQGGSTDTTVTVTTNSLTSGHVAVATVRWNAITGTVSLSDGFNVWTPVPNTLTRDTACSQQLFYAPITTGGVLSLVATLTGATGSGWYLTVTGAEFSGVSTVVPVDISASQWGLGNVSATTPTIYTAQTNEALYASLFSHNNAFTTPTGWTALSSNVSDYYYDYYLTTNSQGNNACSTTGYTYPYSGAIVALRPTDAGSYTISGSCGCAGATILCIGTSGGHVTADVLGNYVVTGLANGSFTLSASYPGVTFSPATLSKTVASASVTGADFTAKNNDTVGIWQDMGIVLTGTDLPGQPNALYESAPNPSACGLTPNADGKLFKFWFGTNDGVCYAESNDGKTLTRYASNPIISLAHQPFPRLFKNAGIYYLNTSPWSGGSVDMYTCTDGTGINFNLAKASYLTNADYESGQLCVAGQVGSTWHAYYTQYLGGSVGYATGHATSSDLINWTSDSGTYDTYAGGTFHFQVINGLIYGWTQVVQTGIPAYGSLALPSDINRFVFTAPNSPTMGLCPVSTFFRTTTAEGVGLKIGQVADPSIVSVDGSLYMYFSVEANGTGATTQQTGLAIAHGTTFAQLIATCEGVYNIPTPSTHSMAFDPVVTDSFTVGDSNWGLVGGNSGCTLPVFGSGYAQPSAAATVSSAYYIGSGLGNDHYASVTLKASASTSYTGVLARASTSGPRTYYQAEVGWGLGSSAILGLHKFINGTQYDFHTNIAYTVNANDVLTIAAVGSVISVYINADLICSAVDTEITAGAPGFFVYDSSAVANSEISSFTAGTLRNGTPYVSGNCGVAGVTVSYTGTTSGSTTTDGSGNYSFVGLPNDTYTITPSKTGYTFSPTSASETVNGADITGVDFGATQTLVATPTFSPVAGSYGPTQNVTISSTDSGLTGFAITYTVDGTTPVPGSHGTVYSTPVVVASSLTIKAVASATGYANSTEADAAYTINGAVATPTFSPVAGTYTSAQSVTISSATSGVTIYYTTDGSTPTTGSTLYTGPVAVSVSETLKALAVKTNYINSAVGSAAYTINTSSGGGAAWLLADQSSLEDIPRRRGH